MLALDTFITKTQFDLWNKEIAERLDLDNIDDKLKSQLLIRSENVKEKLPETLMSNPIFQSPEKADWRATSIRHC